MFGGIPALLALLIFAIVSGISSPARTPSKAPTHRASHTTTTKSTGIEVGLRSQVFVDPSRTTYDYVTGKSTPGRTLHVEIRYPTLHGAPGKETADAALDRKSSDPLVVFAPGFRLRPSDYAPLLDAWVRAGFMVAAVDFPDTTFPASEAAYTSGQPHGSPEGDIYNQPQDVGFVVKQLLAAEGQTSSWLHRSFDPASIALAGHSDGATVVGALVYDATYASSAPSVRAVLVLSGGEFAISNQIYRQPTTPVPLLVVQSAADLCAAPWQAVKLYDAIGGTKYFLELDQASHLGPYSGTDAAAAAVVVKVTTAVLQADLEKGAPGASQLLQDGAVNGVSAITNASLAAAMATPSGSGPTQCPHG